MASYALVKVLDRRRSQRYPDMPWEPKAAFTNLGAPLRRVENTVRQMS